MVYEIDWIDTVKGEIDWIDTVKGEFVWNPPK
jgi:hypothetical protein